MSRFLFGMLLGGAAVYGAMHYHVVRGNQGVFVVPKIQSDLSGVYTDIRHFTLQDWRAHPGLAAAIMQSNRKPLLEDVSGHPLAGTAQNLVEQIFKSP